MTQEATLEFLRRQRMAKLNAGRMDRLQLEAEHGQVWTRNNWAGTSRSRASWPPMWSCAGSRMGKSVRLSLRITRFTSTSWRTSDEPLRLPWVRLHPLPERRMECRSAAKRKHWPRCVRF